MPTLRGEADLRALARRFADAERRVRALIRRAPEGDRRELALEALEILVALRREAQVSGRAVDAAYAAALMAATGRLGRPAPLAGGAGDLGRVLALRLDRAVETASVGSRQAFAAVTPDDVDEASQDAVTAFVAADGARLGLGGYAEMQTSTIGRAASSRGTRDGVGPDGWIEISSHGTTSPICANIEGNRYPASTARLPPYHPACGHYAIPVPAA